MLLLISLSLLVCVNKLERNREGRGIGEGHRGLEKKEGKRMKEEEEA